jgi:hypothetical protein
MKGRRHPTKERKLMKELIQKLLFAIIKWLIQYLDGYHIRKTGIRKNGGKKEKTKKIIQTELLADGKVVE